MKPSVGLFLLFLLLAPVPGHAQDTTALPALVAKVKPAVVLLRTYDKSGSPLGLGSGFLIDGGRVVTNAHVVEGAALVEVYDFENHILGTTDHAVSLSPRVDLAILPAMSRVPATLRLAGAEPAVGETVIVFGAPEGLANTVSDGIVSAFREQAGRRLMQITAPISPGSSGGPVVNRKGEVVGVSVAFLQSGQNLNFSMPVGDIRALVESPPGRLAFPSSDNSRSLPTTAGADGSKLRDWLSALPRVEISELHEYRLDAGDLRLNDGHYVESLGLVGHRGDVYTILVASSEFDVDVHVADADERGELEPLGSDDDSGGGTDAMMVLRVTRDGPVGILVSSYEAEQVGTYWLLVLPGDRSDVVAGVDSNDSEAQRWVTGASEEHVQYFIDQETIRTVGGSRIQVWMRSQFDEVQDESWGRFDSIKTLLELDCSEHLSRMLQAMYYVGDRVVLSSNRLGDWSAWVPDSVGEYDGQIACRLAGM